MKKSNRANLIALMLCGGLFVCAAGTIGITSETADSAQAATSYYTACNNDNLKLKLPKAWKKLLKYAGTQGHDSGAYHTEVHIGGFNSYPPFRIDAMDSENNYSIVKSKMTATYKGTEYGALKWSLKNETGNEGFMSVENVYLDAWNLARNKDARWDITAKSANSLIKIYSHGKMTYPKVAKLSKKKAISLGKKTIKSYTEKYIIPEIQMQ